MKTAKKKQHEEQWDSLLGIKTTGRDDSLSNTINYPYEPTDYAVLERLANAGYLRKGNVLLDYGCGKGRVGFFLSYETRCKAIGVDYDERMILAALENQKRAASGNRTKFFCENAGKFLVPGKVDRFYFFNPFSTEILEQVLLRIRISFYENPRELLLLFYYPSDAYIARLMREEELEFVDEISCADLFDGNDPRERIMIFRMEEQRVATCVALT